MMDIPFLYTTLYAFDLLLRYDGKREIEIDDLIEWREQVLENSIRQYCERNAIEDGPDIQPIDAQEELEIILNENGNIFSINDNKLILNSNVSIDDITELLKEYPIDPVFLHYGSQDKEMFNLLGIKEIFEFKEKCEKEGYKLEKQIEKEYMSNPYSPKLKLLLFQRLSLIANVYIYKPNYVKTFLQTSSIEDPGVRIDDSFDYYNESEYVKNNEPYPIDNELYQNSEFYEDIMDELSPIQTIIEDFYQYAIFGNLPIYKDKYIEYFQNLYIKENFNKSDFIKANTNQSEENFEDFLEEYYDENENRESYEFNFDIEDEEFAFYTIYIHKLNELIELGCTQLINPRNRLLYAIDDIKYCLCDPLNFKKFYEQSLNYDVDEDSFELFENEAKYFIEDIFEGDSPKKLEKVVFVSTYYQLTKNKEIKKVLNRYKSYPNYDEISKIILGNIKKDINKKRK